MPGRFDGSRAGLAQVLHDEIGERGMAAHQHHAGVLLGRGEHEIRVPRAVHLSGDDPRLARITSYNVCYTKLLRIAHEPYASALLAPLFIVMSFAFGLARNLGRKAALEMLLTGEFISYNFV